MLKVNGKEALITKTKFTLSHYKMNGIHFGYCGYLKVYFKLDGKDGYFDFCVDTIKEKDISYYINREYHCIPIDQISEIHYLEIFDTIQFYDVGTFSQVMHVEFKELRSNQMKVKVIVEEEFTSIDFDDFVDIEI